jgi:hypothetical protein
VTSVILLVSDLATPVGADNPRLTPPDCAFLAALLGPDTPG